MCQISLVTSITVNLCVVISWMYFLICLLIYCVTLTSVIKEMSMSINAALGGLGFVYFNPTHTSVQLPEKLTRPNVDASTAQNSPQQMQDFLRLLFLFLQEVTIINSC